MVRGLSVFQAWFKDFEAQYVLIGGTAAKITMAEEGLEFRGTKDLDIILHIEMLTPEFGQKFWAFVQAGGYQLLSSDPSVKGMSCQAANKTSMTSASPATSCSSHVSKRLICRLASKRSTSRSVSLPPSIRVEEPMLSHDGHTAQGRQTIRRKGTQGTPSAFEFINLGDQCQDLWGDLKRVGSKHGPIPEPC